MRKLPFLALATAAALMADPTNAEPSAMVLAWAKMAASTPVATIGQAHSLRSLTVGSFKLGI